MNKMSLQKSIQNFGIKQALKYMEKDPEENIPKLMDMVDKFAPDGWYEAGIHNLFELYLPISDYWMITDNSMSPMEVIAKGFKNDKREVYNLDIFTKLEHHE